MMYKISFYHWSFV